MLTVDQIIDVFKLKAAMDAVPTPDVPEQRRCELCGVVLQNARAASHAWSRHHAAFVVIDRRTRAGWVPEAHPDFSRYAQRHGLSREHEVIPANSVTVKSWRDADEVQSLEEWLANEVASPTLTTRERRRTRRALYHVRELLAAARQVRAGAPWWLAWRMAESANIDVIYTRGGPLESIPVKPREPGNPFWTRMVRT
jgi:hypothetical protein